MDIIRAFLRYTVRFLVVWLITTASLVITNWLLPGIAINPVPGYPTWAVAAAASFVLALVNLFIRPVLLLLAVPLGFIAVFVAGFFVNAVTLRITANVVGPSFEVDGWVPAFLGGMMLAVTTMIISGVVGFEDTGAFYEGLIQRWLGRERSNINQEPTNGLVMLEIDGLSYHHIRKAIDEGYMPHVKKMLERDGYVLSPTDCGLPSQTSACQTGILFGDNYDIPAFRWYDKTQDRLFVSGNDAAQINARYAKGQGLLRDGASVNNMMNGDARISLLTASHLRGGTPEEKRARAQDIYLLLLNSNFLMRVFGMFIGEAMLEIYQYARDVLAGTQPRLNRLHKAYPFVRAVTTVFMREVSGLLTIMQIIRGEPAIYTTWPGYDEVAHHSGPWSKYAFSTLRGFDRFIGVVQEFIETKAPRPYELFLLSDHGQSFGPTFLMRYGYTLKEYIERHMPEGTVIVQTLGGDDGSVSVASTAAELGNVQVQGLGGRVGQMTARQMQKAAERNASEPKPAEDGAASKAADVTFCGSGNLGQVYFHAFGHRTTLSELNAAFPEMVDAVVNHEGVGIVVVLSEDGQPVVFGKHGQRNLHTGEIAGEDPLLPYGDVEKRAWQLRRIADFPSAGDLTIISTVYPDGSVAALEELIGNHGGLGGEQTDSFLLHPGDMTIPPTRNSIDLFAVLDARRGLTPRQKEHAPRPRARDDWAMSNLLAGVARVSDWIELAVRSLLLDRTAYRVIADFGLTTGPALLLSLLGIFASVFVSWRATSTGLIQLGGEYLASYGMWLLTVLLIHGATRVLRGKGQFTQTFRVMGFVQAINILQLLRLIQPLDSMIFIATSLITLIANWLAVAEAHRLRGWRTIILPLLYLLIFSVGILAIVGLMRGLEFAIDSILARFGLLP